MYLPTDAAALIDDLVKLCKDRGVTDIKLSWPDKGRTLTYPFPNMEIKLSITDTTLGIMPFEPQLPATFAKVVLAGDGDYKTISRSDLEIVLSDFIAAYGGMIAVI